MHKLEVRLGARSYPILIAPALLEQSATFFQQHQLGTRLVVITDRVVEQLHAERALTNLQSGGFRVDKIVVSQGERYKTLATFNRIIGEMLKLKCDRDTVVAALGGGVIGDLAGFVAAAYMRGLDFVQMPTTLLAQVDASIGGKVAVNHRFGKNMIGAFHQPRLVLSDTDTLNTLPQREILCGLAEMIKHGLIRDEAYFAQVEQNLSALLALQPEAMSAALLRSCALKAEIVSRDERESGVRALLNFGHTIGHALEAACGFEALRHGEAVLLGMLAEAYLAKILQKLSPAGLQRIENFMRKLPLTPAFAGIRMDEIENFVARDKKAKQGAVRMVVLRAIGEAEVTPDWPAARLREAVEYALAIFALPVVPGK